MARLNLSFTDRELDEFLTAQRTARVATTGHDGTPHVVPLWFVWHGGALFLNSTLGNPTVENLLRTGQAAAVIDDGQTYDTLRGAVLTGATERADGDPRLPEVEKEWSEKYLGGGELPYRRWWNRVWLRLTPARIASWDFRKIPAARARAQAAREG